MSVYKPGATIKVRSVCLMPSLKPCVGQKAVRLVLKNPEGAKVPPPLPQSLLSSPPPLPPLIPPLHALCSLAFQTVFIRPNTFPPQVLAVDAVEVDGSGVFEGNLELDSRAPIGSWVVTAEGDDLAAELPVDVDEYVLPKFEVRPPPSCPLPFAS